jgi:hypothetical protein
VLFRNGFTEYSVHAALQQDYDVCAGKAAAVCRKSPSGNLSATNDAALQHS